MIGQKDSIFNINHFLGKQALNVSVLKNRIISNNIANVDTPGYKRKTVTFETELNKALDTQMADQYPTKTTNSKHIPFFDRRDIHDVKPRIFTEYDTNYRNDKNNVDIDREISDNTKNSLYYSSVVQTINHSFSRLKSVMI